MNSSSPRSKAYANATLLGLGYQLYGSPYFGENKIEGAISTFMVAQAMVQYGLLEKPAPVETAPETLIAP